MLSICSSTLFQYRASDEIRKTSWDDRPGEPPDHQTGQRRDHRGGEVAAFTYDAAGRRTSLTYPNGVRTEYRYDDANRLIQVITREGVAGSLISRFDYTMDPVGNWISMTQQMPAQTMMTLYAYDPLDRLVEVKGKKLLQTYAYDPVGNRTSQTHNGVLSSYTSNSLNQYTQVGPNPLTYDARGNLTSDGSLTMTYDTDNRLIQVTTEGSTTTYQYDWMNRLIQKEVE